MHSRNTVDLHDNANQNIKVGHQLVLLGYTVACYSVMGSSLYPAVMQSFWMYPAFGAFAGIMVFKAGLYFYDLMHAKNKNFSKTAALAREIFSASIFVLAVVGGFFIGTSIGAISPLFYVVSQIIHILYHSITALYMKYRANKAKDSEEREKYQASFELHRVNAAFFVVGTICLSLLATHIPLIIVGIVNAIYNAFCFTLIAYTVITKYRENKHQQEEAVKLIDVNQENDVKEAEKPIENKNFYYQVKNREKRLSEEIDAKEYLFNEIDAKIQKLTDDLQQPEHSFFKQKNKRQAKILALQRLRTLLEDPKKMIDDFNAMLKESLFNVWFNHPFQSFFRKTGDTVDIFDAAKHYLLHHKKREELVEDDFQYALV